MKRMDMAGIGNQTVSRRWWGKVAGMMGLAGVPSLVEGKQSGKNRIGHGRSAGQLFEAMERRMMMSYVPLPGGLDPAFDGDGFQVTALGTSTADSGTAVTTQADGKIVVAAETDGSAALIRYNTNGSLDTTFNSTGKLITSLMTKPSAVVLDSSNNIYIGGYRHVGVVSGVPDDRLTIVKITANGVVDTSFGSSGVVSLQVGNVGVKQINSLVVEGNNLVAVAEVPLRTGISQDLAVIRMSRAAGVLDGTFGSGGIKTLNVGNYGGLNYQLAKDGNGNYIVGGSQKTASTGTAYQAVALKLNSSGVQDTSFGSSGWATISLNSVTVTSMVVQSTGRIVLGGTYTPTTKIFLGGLTSSGQLDSTFGYSTSPGWNITASGSNVHMALDWNNDIYIGAMDLGQPITGNYNAKGSNLGDNILSPISTPVAFGFSLLQATTMADGGKPVYVGYNDNGDRNVLVIQYTEDKMPTAPDLLPSSDSQIYPETGSFYLDDITNDTTPTIGGSADVAGVGVAIYVDDVWAGSGTSNAQGLYEVTVINPLSEGAHTIKTKITGSLNTPTSILSPGLTITIDTTSPAAPTTAPDLMAVDDSGQSSTDNITNVSYYSAFSGTTTPFGYVLLYVNGVWAGEWYSPSGVVQADASGHYTNLYEGVFLADGVYSVTIHAVDEAYNISAAAGPALLVTIDTVAPAVPAMPDMTAASDTGASSTDNITKTTTPVFTGTAAVGAIVTLLANGTSVGTATADASGNWSITSSTLADGNYNITATATDLAGNVSAESGALAITIDSVAPTAPTTAPDMAAASDTGTSNTDNITKTKTPVFTGTTTANTSIQLLAGTTVVASGTTSGTGTYSLTSSTRPDGNYNMVVRLVDVAGNISGNSPALAITIDSVAPTAPTTAPDMTAASDTGVSNTDNITKTKTPVFTGTTTANTKIQLLAGTTVVANGTTSGTGTYSLTSSTLADGNYNMVVRLVDVAGNNSANSPALAITVDSVAFAAPSTPDMTAASDTGVSITDNITKTTTPVFTGTAAVGATVTLLANGTSVGTATADANGNWSITSSTLADGNYNITATATDVAGNVSVASGVLAVTIDATLPAVPSTLDMTTASDTGASSTDNITKTTTPVFTGTTTAGATVTLLANGVSVGTATADANGNWSITSSTLADGNYNITATATDAAGNVSAASSALAVTIDTTLPAAPATLDMTAASDTGLSNTDNITSNNTPVFTGTAAAGATVTLLANGTSVGTATADASGNWSITSSSLADGNYNITATATDTAGNVSAASGALAITIDTTGVVYKEVAGYVAIQAEVYSRAVTGTGTASNGVNLATLNWQYTTQSGYGAMRVPNAGSTNTNVGDSTQANAGPRLEYDVNITTPGNYYLWLRMYGPAFSDDSVHISFDNNTILTTAGNGMSSQATPVAWAWLNTSINNGVAVILNNVTAGSHTLKLWMREDGAIVDQMVLRTTGGSTAPATDNNLALGRNALASSSVAGFAPSNAVDGSATSLWTSTAAGTQTLTVDLGASFALNRIKLTWGANYATGYRIQVGSSAAFGAGTYTEYNPGAQNGGVDDLTALSLTGRYVRIVMDTPVSGATSYQLGELEVYGA